MAKKPLGRPTVCVTWLDAMGELKGEKDTIDNAEPSSLLIENKTYGILYKQDDYALVIVQEDSIDTVDYTVIPKSIVTSIKVLK